MTDNYDGASDNVDDIGGNLTNNQSQKLSQNLERIELFKVFMSEDVIAPITETLMSGYIAQGPVVEKYENALKTYYQNDKIVTVNAATSGLHLSLRLLQKEIENEGYTGPVNVLSCPQTCTATNFVIPANGYGIKWVDIDSNTCNLNLDDLKNKLDNTTRIIMIVHWSGYPVNLDKLQTVRDYAQKNFGYTPWIVQDCAHAFGAKFNGTYLPNYLDRSLCVYSTQAIKHLTTGDGGFVVLPTEELYNRAKLLRWYGISREAPKDKKDYRIEQDVPEWGYKFHMNDINATIGLYNLPYIADHLTRAKEIARYYNKCIQNPKVKLMDYPAVDDAAWWIYTIRVQNKERFIQYMDSKGIRASQVHKRNDNHSCLAEFKCDLPILDEFEKELVCIPIGWWINNEQMKYVVECVNNFY